MISLFLYICSAYGCYLVYLFELTTICRFLQACTYTVHSYPSNSFSLKCGSKLAQRTCWIYQWITSEDSRASCRYMYVLINTFSTYIYIYIYGQKTEAASASQLLHCSIKNTNTHEAVDLRCTSIHDDFSITLGPPIICPSMSLSFDRSIINYVSTSFCLINAFMNELKEAISILYKILL